MHETASVEELQSSKSFKVMFSNSKKIKCLKAVFNPFRIIFFMRMVMFKRIFWLYSINDKQSPRRRNGYDLNAL